MTLGIEENFLNLTKGTYKKPAASMIPDGESLNSFSLKLETRQRFVVSPLLFKIILDILAIAVSQGKVIKDI